MQTDERNNAESGVDRQAREGISYFHERDFVGGRQMSLGVLRIIILEA